MPHPPSDDASLPAGVTPLEPDDPRELGGHRILGRIGQGGMGLVYLGQMRSGRRLAIKVVRADYARDEEFRSRFRREAVSAQKVRGHFTAALIDADLDGSSPWLATEYIPGPTLARTVATDGPLPEPEVRSLIAHLAEALQAVHRAGLVHRDLKAGNVLLGPDGPYLIDLGIAQSSDATSLTATGAVLGTPMVMAPEQATGRAVSPATDVWALGALACFAATGQHPFGTGRPDVMYYRVVHEDPQLDTCPDYVRPFVAACLAKDPQDRPTVREILDAHPELVGATPQPAPEPQPHPEPWDDAEPRPEPSGVGATPAARAEPEPDAGSWFIPEISAPLPDLPGDEPTNLASTQSGRPPTAPPAERPAQSDPSPARGSTGARSPRRRRLVALAASGVVVVGAASAAVIMWPWGDSPTDAVDADNTPTATAQAPGDAVIDACLIGRWEQTSMTDRWTLLDEDVEVEGWDGRIVEFRADGTEIVTYDDADPVRAELAVGSLEDTWHGTATFEVTTDGDTLSFASADYSDTTVERQVGGLTETYVPPSAPGQDLTFTCDDTTQTQSGGEYSATFTRLADG